VLSMSVPVDDAYSSRSTGMAVVDALGSRMAMLRSMSMSMSMS